MSDRTFNSNGEEVTSQGADNTQAGEQGPSFEQGSEQPTQQTQTQGQQGGNESLQRQVEVLEKRLRDKDEFIETLKTERKQDGDKISNLESKLEELSEKSRNVEEVLERMNRNDASHQSSQGNDSTGLTREEAMKLAEDLYEQKQSQQEYEANLRSVAPEVQKAYGAEKADAKIAEIARQNDMTFDEAFDLAGRKPNAFRRLFLPQSSGSSEPSAPSGSVNTAGFEGGEKQAKPRTPFFKLNDTKSRMQAVYEKAREMGVYSDK